MKTVDNESLDLFGSAKIYWNYPEIYDVENRDSIILELLHTRAVNAIRIMFDSARDGYIIFRQTVFNWPIHDKICDPKWEEIAFISAWLIYT